MRGRALRTLGDTLAPKADTPAVLELSWLVVSGDGGSAGARAPAAAGECHWNRAHTMHTEAYHTCQLTPLPRALTHHPAPQQDALMLDSLEEARALCALHGYEAGLQDGLPVALLYKVGAPPGAGCCFFVRLFFERLFFG